MYIWAPLHLDDHLRLICFLSTSVYSALGVSAIMRYVNRRFTYLLTYLLTYIVYHVSKKWDTFIFITLAGADQFS